jgi:CheY-like chemotaxis protein
MGRENRLILLIDDDNSFNEFHEKIIRGLEPDTRVISYTNPEKAVDFLKNKHDNKGVAPNFIFMDINMPVLSGWEFIERIKLLPNSFFSSTIIYFVSTFPNPGDQLRINAEPLLKDWMEKPLSKEAFIDVLNNL